MSLGIRRALNVALASISVFVTRCSSGIFDLYSGASIAEIHIGTEDSVRLTTHLGKKMTS
jgi:hypothetical protein